MKTSTSKIFHAPVSRAFALGMVLLGALTGMAQTPLPIYEPFPASYTNGTVDETVAVPATNTTTYPARRLRNGTTASLWSIGGSPGGGSTLVVGGPAVLSYPGLYQDTGTPSVGVYVRTNLTTANRTAGILFPTINSGSIYASFLLNVQQLPATTNRCLVKFETATSGTGSGGGNGAMAGVFLTASGELGLSKSSTVIVGVTNGSALSAGTHLVVTRYTFNGGTDDDEVALWIDPAAGDLNAPSAPTPTLTWATGTDVPSISSFYIQAPQTSPPQVPASFFFDELRLANNWAEVTSTQALCTAASITTSPANRTVNEGIAAMFTCVAGGTTPNFQWQVSTNSGTTWNNVSSGVGGTSAAYSTPPSTPADNGRQYRVIATVPCNGSSATSAVATVTVVNAVPTPNGVVVDDVFQDGVYNNLPYSISNSVWLAGVASTLDASSGVSMLATPQSGSVNWVGYFTDDSVTNLPVHLPVGKSMKGSVVFNGTTITASGGGLRMGFFDYADGATRLAADGFGNNVNAVNVRGYMVSINYGTSFSANPITIFARQNLGAADLMGTAGDYSQLGAGPANLNGQPAFQNGVNYTLELTVSRRSTTSCDITCSITGGGSNWTHTVTDSVYAYPRFDTFAVRAANASTTASQFEFTRLLVQVVDAAPNSIPLNIAPTGNNITLTWSNPVFGLQAAPTVTGTYTNVPGATSPYVVPAAEAQRYFRLSYP